MARIAFPGRALNAKHKFFESIVFGVLGEGFGDQGDATIDFIGFGGVAGLGSRSQESASCAIEGRALDEGYRVEDEVGDLGVGGGFAKGVDAGVEVMGENGAIGKFPQKLAYEAKHCHFSGGCNLCFPDAIGDVKQELINSLRLFIFSKLSREGCGNILHEAT